MSDPIDITKVPQYAAQATEATKENTAAQVENTAATQDNVSAQNAASNAISNNSSATKNQAVALYETAQAHKKNSEAIENVVSDMERMFTHTLANTTAFNNFGAISETALSNTGGAINSVANNISGVGELLGKVGGKTTAFGAAISEFSGLIAKYGKTVAGNMSSSLTAVQLLETGLSSMLVEGGNASQMFDSGSTSGVNDFTDKIKMFNQQVTNLSLASGIGRTASAELMKQLGSIPGQIEPGARSFESLAEHADATSKVIAGTGINQKTVLDEMKNAYENLGATATEQLQYVAQLSQAAQASTLGFDQTKATLDAVTGSFREFGNETDGAVAIIDKFGPAFTKMHVGAKTASDIIKGLTDGISIMNVAQKGFLSSSTGGAGGLRGGFQIDKLLQEGKLKEVEAKLEQALKKQFGGKIVSLNEATSNDKSAAQYQKQLSMVQQGPFGSLAQKAGGAEKLLEALSKGGGASSTSGANQLKTTLDQGKNRQDRSNTAIAKIATGLEDIASKQDIKLSTLLRGIAGDGNADKAISKAAAEQSKKMDSNPVGIGDSLSETFSSAGGVLDKISQKLTEGYANFKGVLDTREAEEKVRAVIQNNTNNNSNTTTTQVGQTNASPMPPTIAETAQQVAESKGPTNPLVAQAIENANRLSGSNADKKGSALGGTASNDNTVQVQMNVQCTDCGKKEMHSVASGAAIDVIKTINSNSAVG
jgi:hypothetical protein